MITAGGLSSLLLFSYISSETIRTNYAYYAFKAYPSMSPSQINLLSELAKLFTALVVILNPFTNKSTTSRASQYATWLHRHGLSYALPAALYLINNLIYMTILPLTSPSLLQVCLLAKLPATGILHHYMVKRQRNHFAWLSLFMLCIGLVVFNIPNDLPQSQTATGWYLAPVASAVIAALSAIASISSERLVKEGDFWLAQAGLYTWGVIFSLLSIPVMPFFSHSVGNSDDKVDLPLTTDYLVASATLIAITAGTGLIVASLLRFRDNILKVIGTSATLVTVAMSQYVFRPELRASNFTASKVCGASIVAVCTWCYNHWNQAPWPPLKPAYSQLDSEMGKIYEGGEVRDYEDLKVPPGQEAEVFQPDATKIACCALVIGFVTLEMAVRM